ncbi:RHS repeat-associated core domain-containing protein [Chimaeribacter arupi]|uniref:RHS repeat-associated core domain-containing protein n=1 Tax=Chimaeribacter arupi TaxID=2060066 RepID=A0A2N5EIK9_9GAMM|nr:RHS repeat-associated core domain-containing protein [Chimaeribacter arupi]PLR44750.1 hypothetical protein CYR34_18685 [Chimaeribacter arupi]
MNLSLTGNDANNSTLFALSGNTLSAFRYSPFGATPPPDASATPLPGFNGERADPLTGVTHLGNGYRAFSPALFRFTCPDSESPFGEGGINAYAYCENDPVNMTDPSGHGLITMMIKQTLKLGVKLGMSQAAADGITTAMASAYLAFIETSIEGAAALATGIAGSMEMKKNPVAAQKLMWAGMGFGGALGVLGTAHYLAPTAKSLWRRLLRRGPAVELIEMRPRAIAAAGPAQERVFVGYHGTSTKFDNSLGKGINPSAHAGTGSGTRSDHGFYTTMDYGSADVYALRTTARTNNVRWPFKRDHQRAVYEVYFDNDAYQGPRQQEIRVSRLYMPEAAREAIQPPVAARAPRRPPVYEARFSGSAVQHLSLVKRASGEGAPRIRAASLKQTLRLE